MDLIIIGAVAFAAGFFIGSRKRDEYKEVYAQEYSRTNGLFEPVKRR